MFDRLEEGLESIEDVNAKAGTTNTVRTSETRSANWKNIFLYIVYSSWTDT
jgi:hypothetical protein